MSNTPGYIALIRSGNCLMAGVSAAIGTLIASLALNMLFPVDAMYVFVAVFLITGAGNTINDVFDSEIDRINKPHRPIPSGTVIRKNALYFSIVLFAVGILVASFIRHPESGMPIAFYIAVINSAILIEYARTLKRTPFFGNLAVGYLTGSTFLFGGAVFGVAGLWAVGVLFMLSMFATLGREIVKDIEDIEGDKAMGADTLPIRIGARKSAYAAAFFGIVAMLLSPLPFMMNMVSLGYILIVGVADAVFLVAIIHMLHNNDPAASSRYFKTAMMIALLAFVIGVVA